jgi:hypothetical protein
VSTNIRGKRKLGGTVQPHFHNIQRFQGDWSAKSEEFFSRHRGLSQEAGDIVTLKTPMNKGFMGERVQRILQVFMSPFSEFR